MDNLFSLDACSRLVCGDCNAIYLVTVVLVCVVIVMPLVWFGYGNVSKLLLLLLCYMGLSWSLFWEVWEISAQAHLQMVEAIIAGSIRWNRVRSFSPSWDIVQYVIRWKNRATKGSKVTGSPLSRTGEQLEVEEDNYESNDDKKFEQIERKCLPPHGSSTLNLLISSTSLLSQLKQHCQRYP